MPFDWEFQKSNFFKLFDTDGDGLISFQSTSSLSLCSPFLRARSRRFSSSSISTEAVNLAEGEFMEMMKAMRKSTGRGNASGIRTGLKATNVDDISVGLVQYLFEDKGKERLHKF